MDYVFDGWCRKRVDLSDFNTHNVKSMTGLFCNDRRWSNIDIEEINFSNIDTSNVKDMRCMFDTGNVTSMAEMFSKCKELDIKSFGIDMDTSIWNMVSHTGSEELITKSEAITRRILRNSIAVGKE